MSSARANLCAAILSAVVVFSESPTGASAQAVPAGCQKTLGYLSGTVPMTGNAKLDALRQTMLSTNVPDVMRNIAAQNLSIPQALDLLDKQAHADAAALPVLESNIRQAAQSPNDDLIAAIKNRNYNRVAIGEDVLSAAIQAYIADDWGQLTNLETAKQIRCLQLRDNSNGLYSEGASTATTSQNNASAQTNNRGQTTSNPAGAGADGSSGQSNDDEPWNKQHDESYRNAAAIDEHLTADDTWQIHVSMHYWDRNKYMQFELLMQPDEDMMILVDFNQNGAVDSMVDKGYGQGYDDSFCGIYLIDDKPTNTACGALPSKAHVSQRIGYREGKALKIINYWIPKSELSNNGSARICLYIYNKTSKKYIRLPSGNFTKTYPVYFNSYN